LQNLERRDNARFPDWSVPQPETPGRLAQRGVDPVKGRRSRNQLGVRKGVQRPRDGRQGVMQIFGPGLHIEKAGDDLADGFPFVQIGHGLDPVCCVVVPTSRWWAEPPSGR